jgi:hypothetical protein
VTEQNGASIKDYEHPYAMFPTISPMRLFAALYLHIRNYARNTGTVRDIGRKVAAAATRASGPLRYETRQPCGPMKLSKYK